MDSNELHQDLDMLVTQLAGLRIEFDRAIKNGSSFVDVKSIHLKIKDLTRLVNEHRAADSSHSLSRSN